jgi:hypothetical protein
MLFSGAIKVGEQFLRRLAVLPRNIALITLISTSWNRAYALAAVTLAAGLRYLEGRLAKYAIPDDIVFVPGGWGRGSIERLPCSSLCPANSCHKTVQHVEDADLHTDGICIA